MQLQGPKARFHQLWSAFPAARAAHPAAPLDFAVVAHLKEDLLGVRSPYPVVHERALEDILVRERSAARIGKGGVPVHDLCHAVR